MNPLLSPTPLEISPAEEQARKIELLSKNESSIYKLQQDKAVIEQRRQELDVESKTKNLDAVKKINQAQDGLIETLLDTDMLTRVKTNTNDPLGYEKLVSGVSKTVDLRDRLIQRAFDISSQTGKRKRIDFAFAGQDVNIAMRIETSDES